MTWLLVAVLAAVVFVLVAFVFKVRSGREVLGAALLLGIAGYALQGSPGSPGAPKAPAEKTTGNAAAGIAERQKLGDGPAMGDKDLIVADALSRHGQFANAAEWLRGAVKKDPNNAQAWLAMGNALVGHAEGTVSPAALYAYGRSAKAAPDSPGPAFVLGLALLQSGRIGEGRAMWADLLKRSPAEAPWRADLEKRLAELDNYLARQMAGGGQPPVSGQ
jgi:cytochrome c-type biogenesis protein CcmH